MDQATNGETGPVGERNRGWYENDQLRADRKYIYPLQPSPRFGARLGYRLGICCTIKTVFALTH